MFSHPDTISTSADLHRQDLLAEAERERRIATVEAPALQWRPLVVRVFALIALSLGLRG